MWEYLINEKYNLIWCNVFKAASSTWFWNFNLLAGYSEDELLSSKIILKNAQELNAENDTSHKNTGLMTPQDFPTSYIRHAQCCHIVLGCRRVLLFATYAHISCEQAHVRGRNGGERNTMC